MEGIVDSYVLVQSKENIPEPAYFRLPLYLAPLFLLAAKTFNCHSYWFLIG